MRQNPKYLIEFDHAEHEFLSRFHEYIVTCAEFLESFGIASRYAWYLIEVPTERLISGIIGEVDILAGNLEPADPSQFEQILENHRKQNPDSHPQRSLSYAAMSLALNDGLKWPPSLDFLVGMEVKSSFLPVTASEISFDQMKSTKTSKDAIRKTRRSVTKLQKMGFDKVGLFEILAAPPTDGFGSLPWFQASHIASKTLEEMRPALEARIPEGSAAGHGVASISGIGGLDEFASGSTSCRIFKLPKENSLLNDTAVRNNRAELDANLHTILGGLPRPTGTPAVYIYNKKNKTISHANAGWIQF